jgi:hypothetical protein
VGVESLEKMLSEFDDLYTNEKSMLKPNLTPLNSFRDQSSILDSFFEKLENKASEIMSSGTYKAFL